MIHTYRELLSDRRVEADVCIVGTGCGGASLGARLAEAGARVVFLERGGHYTRDDFDQRELDMLPKIDGGRGLDSSVDLSVSLTYGNNVGGASVHYWADSYRTPPDRLARWRDEFGLEGHGLEELTPFFEEIERDLHVHPAEDAYFNRMNQLLKLGSERLGWHGHRVPQARKGCIQSGFCMQGCAYDAKQSQLVTYVPRALAKGAEIFADTRAERLEWDSTRRKVTALVGAVLDRATGRPTGKTVRVSARAFVAAAGGYGTPLFLLRNGLRERLPAVGLHTVCNPCPMVHALFDEEIVQYRGIPAAWGVEEFRLARHEGGRYVEGGYLLMANQLQPAMLAAVLPGTGSEHRRLMRDLRKLGGTIAWIDDHDFGRVDVDGEGNPEYHVPIDGTNGAMIRDSLAKQARLLFAVGAKEVLFGDDRDTRITRASQIDTAIRSLRIRPASLVLAAPHPAGGARMGRDPRSSVVGMDHRVHGTDNLFVADPSVFPTGPSVDPSVTIMAFSGVAAGHIRRAIGR